MSKSSVRVYVRLRPVIHEEGQEPEETCLRAVDHNKVELLNWRDSRETLEYSFQQVFAEDSTQEEVFCTCVQPVLARFTDQRQNVTVFTYGPTGAGKTFTILGTNECPGIIPRTIRTLFRKVRQMSNEDEQFSLSMTYLEIYQEKVYDLLKKESKDLPIRQDVDGNIFVPGITQQAISNFEIFEKLFIPASANRRVGATKLNSRSSRSHSILQIQMKCWKKNGSSKAQFAKLYLIDLAGSEDNRRTGNTGIRLKESGSINSSLHVLGKVVDALNSGTTSRIPYRDSKLTRLLQDSLGGSAHTSMIVNVSPEISCLLDTQSTLNFGTKSKSIINKPFTHEVTDASQGEETKPKEVKKVGSNGATPEGPPPPLPFLSPLIQKHVNKLGSVFLNRMEELEKLVLSNQANSGNQEEFQGKRKETEEEFRNHDLRLDEIRKSAKKFRELHSKQILKKEELKAKRRFLYEEQEEEMLGSSPLLIKRKKISTASRKNCLKTSNHNSLGQRRTLLTIEKQSGESERSGDIITIKVKSETQKLHAANVLQVLNSGNEKELRKLHGIGAVRASQINEYRKENENFENVSDLRKVLPSQFVNKFLENTLLHSCQVELQ